MADQISAAWERFTGWVAMAFVVIVVLACVTSCTANLFNPAPKVDPCAKEIDPKGQAWCEWEKRHGGDSRYDVR